MSRGYARGVLSVALILLAVSAAGAGIVVYEEGDKKIEVGGRIQLQYNNVDPDGGDSADDVFFRRLRPYIAGSVTENWYGKIQFDFGKAEDDNEVAVKDAYLKYSGFDVKNLSLSIGNTKTPFAREFLTSSKRQQLVERTFSGDHNFGSPDRQLGLRLDGKNGSKRLGYSVAVGAKSHDPAAGKLDFDSPANEQSDWNEGYVFAGRVDFHPLGAMKFDQGDFRSDDWKYTVGVSAFTWSNDDDVNTYTDPATGLTTSTSKVDLDQATGYELSGGVRGNGLSFDLAYQTINAETVDTGFTGGIYSSGETDLDKLTIEGGYMIAKNFEIAAGYETQDADNYATEWERMNVGLNWFFNKHKAKVQLTYRMGENVDGVDGADTDTTYLQTQFVF